MPPKPNVNAELEAIRKQLLEIQTQGKETARKLDDLTKDIQSKDRKIEFLESHVAILQKTVDLLVIKCDQNEQYSRRTSVRINNIHLPEEGETETSRDVLTKVKDVIAESEADIPANFIDRAHRVGKPFVTQDGVRKQQIIVKFTTWDHRTRLYRARKKLASAKVYLDLTKPKFKLLKECQAKVRESDVVDYVFADVNCALCAKTYNNKFLYFNTAEQFNDILDNQ